ncbi:MAG: eCIS core domain-containing protein [bacterium]
MRVHTSSAATETASAVNARAYTVGRNIVFAEGEFQPETSSGRRLLAHEITHTIQQGHGSPMAGKQVQRTLNDNHDLQAPRFSGNLTLEAAFDDERLISKKNNSTGPHVSLLQQSLIDMGYTLPGFGVDGIFGNETEAAVIRFQRDAGAVLIDGIVGPETMGLFDRHDTTLPGGVGPPQTTGPVPGPLPPPAATCDVPYTAVTFTLANQVASGVSPAALIRIVSVGGRDALQMRGIAPATYTPDVTIHAPSNAAAQAFQVGFASNLLTEFVEYFYTSAAVISSTLPTPTKDGRPLSSGNYDPVYVEGLTPTVNENFLADGDTRNLVWPDVPSEFAFVQLLDNAECAAQPGPADLVTAAFIDSFRTWVVARHRPSGCTRALHHIDWDLNWQTIVTMTAGGPTVAVVSNVINVTETDGDGSPAFIQGGQVPDDLLAANRVCV